MVRRPVSVYLVLLGTCTPPVPRDQLEFTFTPAKSVLRAAGCQLVTFLQLSRSFNLGGQGQGLVALGVLVWRCDVCACIGLYVYFPSTGVQFLSEYFLEHS